MCFRGSVWVRVPSVPQKAACRSFVFQLKPRPEKPRKRPIGCAFTRIRSKLTFIDGAAGGSRTRTPIRTQAPQACQSTSSSTAADHSSSTSCLIIILRLALFVNSIFSPARKKTAKKVLTPGTSYGSIFLALNGAKPLARVVELVDSLASGASVRKDVRVRLPPRAPRRSKVNFAPTFFCLWQKNAIRLLPSSSFPNHERCAGL